MFEFTKKIRGKGGFTLVEMLISMAIFVTFTGILISSYSSIVRAQNEANEQRIMYVEARKVFDQLIQEFRDGMIDYQAYNNGELGATGVLREVKLISKDADVKTDLKYLSPTPDTAGVIQISKSFRDQFNNAYLPFGDYIDVNSDLVSITKFKVYASPVVDPYALENVNKDRNQFQPKVTIYAEFTRDLGENKTPLVMDLQTTISSRIYNQITQ